MGAVFRAVFEKQTFNGLKVGQMGMDLPNSVKDGKHDPGNAAEIAQFRFSAFKIRLRAKILFASS